MKAFAEIEARAVARHGREAVEEHLPKTLSAEELAAIPDDRWLSMMTRRIFQAGFVWRVVEAKWPDFEEVFRGFEPRVVTGLDVTALADDGRVIRNRTKLVAAIDNAHFVNGVSADHGGFGRFIADWPASDIIGLWGFLKQHGSRLGGDTGPRVLRAMGKETFVLTPDVCAALQDAAGLEGKPSSKTAQRQAQQIFDTWAAETGRSRSELSVICAMSVDA